MPNDSPPARLHVAGLAAIDALTHNAPNSPPVAALETFDDQPRLWRKRRWGSLALSRPHCTSAAPPRDSSRRQTASRSRTARRTCARCTHHSRGYSTRAVYARECRPARLDILLEQVDRAPELVDGSEVEPRGGHRLLCGGGRLRFDAREGESEQRDVWRDTHRCGLGQPVSVSFRAKRGIAIVPVEALYH